jgi:hypothetical protein
VELKNYSLKGGIVARKSSYFFFIFVTIFGDSLDRSSFCPDTGCPHFEFLGFVDVLGGSIEHREIFQAFGNLRMPGGRAFTAIGNDCLKRGSAFK